MCVLACMFVELYKCLKEASINLALTQEWINQRNMAEDPELDAFVYEKLIYDKDSSLIQREMSRFL